MMTDKGVPPSGSGYSAEPEPSSTVSAVPVSIPNALGLPRVRLAELLYEHEGFCDAAEGWTAPDRDVPSWIEEYQGRPHSGDCTKQCHPCMTCHGTHALKQWDEFEAMIRRAAIAMEARQGGDGETRLHPKDDSAVRSNRPNPVEERGL